MSLFRLVRRNLWRHPIRTLLTFGFAVLALFLLVFLRSAVTTLEVSARVAAKNRVVVQSATSLFVYMPVSYREKILQIPGVEATSMWNWMGGYFREPQNRFAQFANDVETTLAIYPELEIVEGTKAELMDDRQGVLIGADLASQYGWSIGTRVPIIQTIYAREADEAWAFNVRAIYRSTNPAFDDKVMFIHWKFFEEKRNALRREGYTAEGQDVGIFMTKVKSGYDANAVIASIDARFADDVQRTATQTEAAFQAQFASMLGNIPLLLSAIGLAILVAIFFSVLNTNGMAARERSRDVGVLKALGFPEGTAGGMLLLESVLVIGGGGLVGTVLGWYSTPIFRRTFGFLIPNYHVLPVTLLIGVAVSLAIGFVGGLLPAIRLRRLRTIDVLRDGA